MKTKAAVLWEPGTKWEVEELELDEPREREVLIRYEASGLCHSDEHTRDGTLSQQRVPVVGGHEGSGVIEAVGPGVTRVQARDHIVTSWMPGCGTCRWCLSGVARLCDRGAGLLEGRLLDGTFRLHGRGQDVGQMGFIGTFSQWGVIPEDSCVKVDPDLPLDVLALTACGVPTGWGSAVYAADVRPGEVVAVYGVGGVGMNAVQGAGYAGAAILVAVDPIEFKRDLALKLGATHAVASAAEAGELIRDLTRGVGADKVIVTAGVVDSALVAAAFEATRKGGTLVITGLAHDEEAPAVQIPATWLAMLEKRIQGTIFGSGNPHVEIPKMLGLYRAGKLKLDELVTARYRLEDINQATDDLLAGVNVRGLIVHEH